MQQNNSGLDHATHAKILSHLNPAKPPTTDVDWFLAAHRFLRDREEDTDLLNQGGDPAHAVKLAQRYYQALNKEYAIADLSRLPTLGLRWRTEEEVYSGKGQFTCSARGCGSTNDLHSYEVPFSYTDGPGGGGGSADKKLVLVKVRCCGQCAALAFPKVKQ